MAQSTVEETPTSSNKSDSNKAESSVTTMGIYYDPYREGARDLGNNPQFPPLRRRRFGTFKRVGKGNNNPEGDFKSITLKPREPTLGLDASLWRVLKKEQPQIKDLIRKGAIQEFWPFDDTNAECTVGYDENTAQSIVESSFSPDQLREWAKLEPRQSIIQQINQRLEDLEQGRI